MFKLMLAEVAIQRGQPQVAVPALLELARETRDPRVAQRATESAWNARYSDAALEAAGIWLQADPGSARARQVLAALLVSQQKLDDARAHFEQWLASDKENVGPELPPALDTARPQPGSQGGARAHADAREAVPESAGGAARARAGSVERGRRRRRARGVGRGVEAASPTGSSPRSFRRRRCSAARTTRRSPSSASTCATTRRRRTRG